jgi:hypothetical protein
MPNSDIHNLTAVAGVAASDEFEIQPSTSTVTKRCTTTQITQIEETARITQDNVIEAGVGLNANGTYPAMSDSWYLRTADFATGITDRGGAEANVVESIYGALRLLDSKLYANINVLSQTIRTVTIACSTADILACNAVPKVLIVGQQDMIIEIISVVGIMFYDTAKFEAGTDKLVVRYAGANTVFEFSNAFLESTSESYARATQVVSENIPRSSGIELYCATAPTGGSGNVVIEILYRMYAGGTRT